MSRRILVVDDSATVRQQVAAALTQGGYQVVEACDGADALKKLDPSIALVVSDVNMPGTNGLEMLEKIKAEPRWANLPVLMLTTEGEPALLARAKKAGAKGWIVKPFKPDLLLAAIKKLAA